LLVGPNAYPRQLRISSDLSKADQSNCAYLDNESESTESSEAHSNSLADSEEFCSQGSMVYTACTYNWVVGFDIVIR
jgi:hypothetical protein